MQDLNTLSNKELKAIAAENNVDLTGATKKSEVIAKIEEVLNMKGETKMEELTNVQDQSVVEGEPVPVEEAKEDKKYFLENGKECSRSAYIRQQFSKDMSRQDIAKELGIKYYIVYSATANMFNAAHPEGAANVAGKGSVLVPKVNGEFKFVNAEGTVVQNEADAVKVPRAELMRELVQAGKTRSEIKDHFQVPYATVYAATKDLFEGEGTTRGKKMIIHPETQTEMSRADYIRELFAKGMDRREIAKTLTKMTGDLVDYATVWAATKPKKEETKTEEVPTPVDAPTEA